MTSFVSVQSPTRSFTALAFGFFSVMPARVNTDKVPSVFFGECSTSKDLTEVLFRLFRMLEPTTPAATTGQVIASWLERVKLGDPVLLSIIKFHYIMTFFKN